MRIWDCILYAGERPLLEARVEHLKGVVHGHVIVEGFETFTGRPRQPERPDLPGCYHAVAPTDPAVSTPWERETHQRNYCLDALLDAGADDDDMVFLGDVDEFPNKDVLAGSVPLALNTQSLVYFLNGWQGNGYGLSAVYMPMAAIRKQGAKICRDDRYRIDRVGGKYVGHAGFHFTYQGGAAAVRRKIQSFSHQEQNVPEVIGDGALEERMERGLWVTQEMTDHPTIHYVPLESFAPPAIMALAEKHPGWVHQGAEVH